MRLGKYEDGDAAKGRALTVGFVVHKYSTRR